MATTVSSIGPVELGPPQSMSPLQPRSITPLPMPNKIRRKGSFVRQDSSEDFPSSHDSIFEAFCLTASDDSGHRPQLIDLPSRIPRLVKRNDENSRNPSPLYVVDSTEFLYGNGTVLDTITEQRSFATIRSSKGRTKSADDSPSVPFLCHRDSFVLSKTPRRQISFSLDNVDSIKQSYHDACAVIEKEACKPSFVHEIYAEPKAPIHAPPDRPSTPPGMPSWTDAQNPLIPPRQSSRRTHQNLLQRLLSMSLSPATLSSPAIPSSAQTRNRTVSAPVRGRAAPRFRPPKSVYGPIDQHPFTTAPIAKVSQPGTVPILASTKPKSNRLRKAQRVRFTPSATARDSEMNTLQAAIESSITSAPHPFRPFQNANSTVPSTPKQNCTHRKTSGASVAKDQPGSIPSIDYTHVPPRSPRQDSVQLWSPIDSEVTTFPQMAQEDLDALCVIDASRNRAASVTSATFLMSGALRAPTPPPVLEFGRDLSALKKDPWCWKCSLQSGVGKLDQWWMKSAGCVCFVCCGFDIDEEGNVMGSSTHPYSATLRGGHRHEVVASRVVALNERPAMTF